MMVKATDRTGREIKVGDIVSHPDFYGTTMKVVSIKGALLFGIVAALAEMNTEGKDVCSFTASGSYICGR